VFGLPNLTMVRSSLAAGLQNTLTWVIPMLLTAASTAYLSYFYNQKANTELVAQQQRVSDLQQFRASAAQLDQAVGGMSDALVDGSNLAARRADLRNSITRHLSDAQAVKDLLGSDSDQYIGRVSSLREIVDNLGTIGSGQQLWQTSINMMSERRHLLVSAQSKALKLGES
jgi:hypothetical protein